LLVFNVEACQIKSTQRHFIVFFCPTGGGGCS
jgi:hypothetical protein